MLCRSEMQMQSRKLTVVFDKNPKYGQRAAHLWYITLDVQNILCNIWAIGAMKSLAKPFIQRELHY